MLQRLESHQGTQPFLFARQQGRALMPELIRGHMPDPFNELEKVIISTLKLDARNVKKIVLTFEADCVPLAEVTEYVLDIDESSKELLTQLNCFHLVPIE